MWNSNMLSNHNCFSHVFCMNYILWIPANLTLRMIPNLITRNQCSVLFHGSYQQEVGEKESLKPVTVFLSPDAKLPDKYKIELPSEVLSISPCVTCPLKSWVLNTQMHEEKSWNLAHNIFKYIFIFWVKSDWGFVPKSIIDYHLLHWFR